MDAQQKRTLKILLVSAAAIGGIKWLAFQAIGLKGQAAFITFAMGKRLKLDDNQKAKMATVTLEFLEALRASKNEASCSARKAARQKAKDKWKSAAGKILSDEQMKKCKAFS